MRLFRALLAVDGLPRPAVALGGARPLPAVRGADMRAPGTGEGNYSLNEKGRKVQLF